MGIFTTKKTIVIHDGKFHADDLFAVATLRLVLDHKCTVIRTRDEKKIADADYVADVGAINDQDKNRFDHHMTEGAGFHANGIPYASFGLVWKKFGVQLAGSAEIAARIEEKLVSSIDADDNGVSLVTPKGDVVPYGFQSFLYTYRPTWREDPSMYDTSFMELLPVAERIIMREIAIARDTLMAKDAVEKAYQNAEDKRIIVLDANYPFQETLIQYPEPLYIVSQRPGDTKWKAEAIHEKMYGFDCRKQFPESWAGLRDAELEKVTGVQGAVFCHRARFLAVAETKEGALALAKLAVEK